MRSLLAHIGDESGQVFIFVAVFLTVLVGMAALVIDVGSWYRAHRSCNGSRRRGANRRPGTPAQPDVPATTAHPITGR